MPLFGKFAHDRLPRALTGRRLSMGRRYHLTPTGVSILCSLSSASSRRQTGRYPQRIGRQLRRHAIEGRREGNAVFDPTVKRAEWLEDAAARADFTEGCNDRYGARTAKCVGPRGGPRVAHLLDSVREARGGHPSGVGQVCMRGNWSIL